MTYSLKDALYHGSYIAAADLAAHVAHDKLFSGKKTVPAPASSVAPATPSQDNKYLAKIASLQVMQEPDRPSVVPYMAGGAVAGTGALFGYDALTRHLEARSQEEALDKAKSEWQQQHAADVSKKSPATYAPTGRSPYTGAPLPPAGRDAAGMPRFVAGAAQAPAPAYDFTPDRSHYTGAPKTAAPEGNRFLSVLTKKPLRTAGFLGGGALAGMALYPNS